MVPFYGDDHRRHLHGRYGWTASGRHRRSRGPAFNRCIAAVIVAQVSLVHENARTPLGRGHWHRNDPDACLGIHYYLPAILADDMASGTGSTRTWVFGAISGSLLVAAGLGPPIGRVIDRHGGRLVLVVSSIVLAIGLRPCYSPQCLGSVCCLGYSWRRHGAWSLRRGVRHAGYALWQPSPRADHRHHSGCRVCIHDRLAANGGAGG
jgi:hypothetical protein